jgi:diguanylate cyclase (GGDEF)-like protein/PAS domain S-box-containing protein
LRILIRIVGAQSAFWPARGAATTLQGEQIGQAAQENMENQSKPTNKDLAGELESLREELAHLHSLIQQHSSESPSSQPRIEAPADQALPMSPELFNNGPIGVAAIDSRFRFVRANPAFCSLLGYTEQEILSLYIADVAQDPEICMEGIRQVADGVLSIAKFEEQLLAKNREPFWVQITVSTTQEPSTDVCLIFIEETSARRWAETVLHSERQLLQTLINNSVDGILAFDREGFLTIWNPGMERIFGVNADETLGRQAFQVCPFLKDLGEDENFAAALKGNKTISRDKSYSVPGTNRQVYFEGYYGPMFEPDGTEVIGGLAIVRDITERKLAEEEKRISEERYRELFENACDMVYTHDLEGKMTAINKAAERILGYTQAEVLQKQFIDFVSPAGKQTARRMIEIQISDAVPMTQELEIVAKDKTRIILAVNTRLIYLRGKPIGIQGIARDISEHKKADLALQEANLKLESTVGELEQRTREMTLLNEMGDILRACLTTEEVYEVLVKVAREVFPDLGGALFVIGSTRNMVESKAQWGSLSQEELTFTPDECWALRRGRIHWVEDTRVGLLCKHLPSPPPEGYLCVPMMAQSETVGIMYLSLPPGVQMPETRQRLAMAMAEQVAMGLSNLRLHEKLRNQSIRDHLTGLFNRSFLEESLELELRRAVRSQVPLSVIILELDNFQSVVESYGLDLGDSILRRAAMMLQANVRKGDVACRFSNQTFVILLPNSGFPIGRQRAETLRNLTRTLEVKFQGTQVGNISASFGLAVFPSHGQTGENLLRSAEAALTRAKSSGGDCIVVAS